MQKNIKSLKCSVFKCVVQERLLLLSPGQTQNFIFMCTLETVSLVEKHLKNLNETVQCMLELCTQSPLHSITACVIVYRNIYRYPVYLLSIAEQEKNKTP